MADRLRRAWHGTLPGYLAAALGALVSVQMWFRPGTFVATGDMGPFIRQAWAEELPSSWSHAITGAGSATYVVARWYEFVLVDVVHALGGSDTLAQRLFYSTIYPMVALGVAGVAAVFTRNRLAIAAAGLFGVWNGFFLTRLPNPLNIISVGACALAAALLLRVAAGRKLPAPLLALVVLPMSFLAYNPPMLTVALAWTAVGLPVLALAVFGWRGALAVVRYGLVAAPWVVLVNLFWLVPFAQAFTGGGGAAATAQTDPTAWAWSQAENSIPNVLTLSANWAWHKPQYLPFTPALDEPWWIWLRYLLPVLAFLAPVAARPSLRRAAVVLLGLVLVFTLLGKGLQPPLSGFNMFLYERVPGFWLFREPMSKLGQLIVIFGGALIAIFVDGMAVHLRALDERWRPSATAATAAAVVLLLVWPYPLITGEVIPDERPSQPPAHVAVPSFWRDAADLIDASDDPGRTLVLPLDDYYQMPTTWGFFGVDSIATLLVRHPVLQRKPDGYFGDTPGFAAQVDAVEQALLAGDLASVPPLLENLTVSHVIVRHDLIRGMPGRTFADGRVLSAAMARVPGATLTEVGELEVWEVGGGTEPTVRTESEVLSIPGEPDAIAATVAMTDPGVALVGDDPTEIGTTPPVEREPGAAVADDGVWWPVEPVADGIHTTTFETDGGLFDVAQVARAAATLTPTEVADPASEAGATLELQDRAQVRLDGAPVSQRPPTLVPIDRPGVVAVRAGFHDTSLDGWLSPSLPPASSTASGAAATVPVGAATPFTAWALDATQPALARPSEVYDCNNYEPRPFAQLGLTSEVVPSEGGVPALRLSARDHAACVGQDVVGVAGGETVRVRFEYRSVEGKRPAVCLLETDSQQCLPDARLRLDDEWVRHEVIATLSPEAGGLRLVFHADVGLRLRPTTTTEYRAVSVERLDVVAETEVWPEAVPKTTVELAPGRHTLEVVGGPSGSVLADFEAIDDCFRYDDQTLEEAGISARELETPEGRVYELTARDHMGCRGATAPDFGAAGLYELRYDYRSVALRKPKVCLYQRGPDACEPLPANGPETEWSTYAMPYRPRQAAEETRLYLYGMRDLDGREVATVQYRDPTLTPAPTSSAVVLRRRTAATSDQQAPRDQAPGAEIRWRSPDPATFVIDADSLPDATVLSVAETSAPGWRLTGLPAGATAETVVLDGWKAAWVIDGFTGPAQLRAAYAPAALARTALVISLATLPLALVALVVGPRFRRWLTRRWLTRRRAARTPVVAS